MANNIFLAHYWAQRERGMALAARTGKPHVMRVVGDCWVRINEHGRGITGNTISALDAWVKENIHAR
jgi:hypothetical protein